MATFPTSPCYESRTIMALTSTLLTGQRLTLHSLNTAQHGVLQAARQIDVLPLDESKIEKLTQYAIRRTNNSAAGPYGIPYAAYKKTCGISTVVLADALKDMYCGGDADAFGGSDCLPHEFNYATMVCLPNKVAWVHPQFGDFHILENT